MPILGKKRKQEWETVWKTLSDLKMLFAGDQEELALNALMQNIQNFIREQFQKADAGKPAIWYNIGYGPPLIYALGDVNNVPLAEMSALCSIIGDQADTEALIDASEAAGYSAECCSADKAGIGAVVKGLYPDPCCIVGINTPCDSQVAAFQAMAELRNKVPVFPIDVPPYDDDRTLKYIAGQLAEMIPFLEKNTGRKMDWDRLKEVCQTVNRTSEYLWQWMEWRSLSPTLQPSKLCAFTMVLVIALLGSPLGENIARGLAEDARKKAQEGAKYFDEKVRAIWYQDPVWWDIQLYDWMEAELGLVIPMDIFGFYASEAWIDIASKDSILFGLARLLVNCGPMSRQFRGTMKRYIGDFMYLHQRFQADCGIMAGHIACKHAWGGIGLFKEACKKAGIPLLIFEFDMFDSRILTRKELQFELKRFTNEIVIPQKARLARKS